MRVDAVRDPLLDDRSWRIDPPFDLDKLADEAAALVGTFDFRAFRSASDPRIDTVRTLTSVRTELVAAGERREVHERARQAFAMDVVVEGTAFLHNMVRIIVGTLVDVARGRLRPGAVARGLASGRREDLGITAPAHGLVLDEVFLDPTLPGGASWP